MSPSNPVARRLQSPDTGTVRAIKRRLIERVADRDHRQRTVPIGRAGWRPFAPGIRIKVLRRRQRVLSYLLHFEPGAALPAHRHPMDEECVVLEGVLQIGSRVRVGAGSYHLARRGALHATIRTETGATVFLRGAVPHPRHLLA